MTTNTKYENQSQLLFVNTEAGFGGLGDQLDKWRIDLNTSPFSNTDDTILRASVTQFHMCKNFYNINKTNNAVRVIWKAFNMTAGSTSVVINATDVVVHILPGDYTTHDQLAMAFFNAVKGALDTAVSGGNITFATSNAETSMPNTHRNRALASRDDSAGRAYQLEPPDTYRFQGSFTCSNTAFRFNELPVIQCLSIATNETLFTKTTVGGSQVPFSLPEIDFYNDSYALLGGRRIETFEERDTATLQSFSAKKDDHVLYIQNWFPMNNILSTTPYLYLRSRNSRTQASSNLEEGSNPHNHTMLNSSILAKIPRFNARDGSVSYFIENSPYFTNITAQQLNNIELELTDAKGRPIPSALTSESVLSVNHVDPPDGVVQNRDGNGFCDMVLLIEKYQFNNPSALKGFGPPKIAQLNPAVFSTNPMMSVDNDGYK